jgi:hypothetical protein
MVQQAVPLIRRENYNAVRRLLNGDLPRNLSESGLHRSIGHNPVCIEIDPEEFTRFCQTLRDVFLRGAIIRFANEKLARQL